MVILIVLTGRVILITLIVFSTNLCRAAGSLRKLKNDSLRDKSHVWWSDTWVGSTKSCGTLQIWCRNKFSILSEGS